jgi:hypothetical protein
MPARRPALQKLLFIGNSFTARNDLPGLIARLAQARGHVQEHRLISVGGASLRTHWNKGEAPAEIRSGQYDYVVLQEQSTLPVKNAQRMAENVRLFGETIRAAGAKMALYMTWSRRHAPDAQRAITDAYTSVGRELGATVVPVGVAWHKFRDKHDRPDLYDKDGSHPSLAGSYLAACVFLGALFGESPVGIDLEADDLPPADAELLQRAARDAMR